MKVLSLAKFDCLLIEKQTRARLNSATSLIEMLCSDLRVNLIVEVRIEKVTATVS